MPEITVTTSEAMAFLIGRQHMIQNGRELPFAVGYVFQKIDRKLVSELKEYESARMTACEAEAEKDGQGKPLIEHGGYCLTDDAKARVNVLLAPMLAESITLTNVRKITVAELANVCLTEQESQPLAPFIADDAA